MSTPTTSPFPPTNNSGQHQSLPPVVGFWTRIGRGIGCCLTFLITPFGWFCYGRLIRRLEPERLDKGLVLVLTGIEGRSFLNVGLLAGLIDGGVKSAVEVVDWTTGNKFLFLLHLRGWKRNQRVAGQLAAQIVDYQDRYPGRPVWIVGHSGGGGIALLTAAALPIGRQVTGVVMLATAISPEFDLLPALDRVQTSVWNYTSTLDFFFLIIATSLLGTLDGRHSPTAGAIGFQQSVKQKCGDRLIEIPWNWRMLLQFHAGGHFGCVNRVFIAEEVAPRIIASENAAKS